MQCLALIPDIKEGKSYFIRVARESLGGFGIAPKHCHVGEISYEEYKERLEVEEEKEGKEKKREEQKYGERGKEKRDYRE